MYCENDLVAVAKRENNIKRSYLLVNPLQGKHIPVSPGKALELFEKLGMKVKNAYPGEKVLYVGFAETATAIGSHVAITAGGKYIQTTREKIDNIEYLFFSEAHSHATEQKLVKDDIEQVISDVDRIVFVEDEVTTGNTILNIVNILKENYGEIKFGVASLLNGMSDEALEIYENYDIDLHYLLKTNHERYTEIADIFKCDGDYILPNFEKNDINILEIGGKSDARRLLNAEKYNEAINDLWTSLEEKICIENNKSVLVIGTEECMYPAICVGEKFEKSGCVVRSHSTTRSPISVSYDKGYPLNVRYELRSLYDDERTTYIYDLDAYDEVIIITDAKLNSKKGLYSLVNAVKKNNEKITVVRWY